MEYAIFPMKTINISQRHNGTTSHGWDGVNGCKVIDLEGLERSGTGICEEVYAPTMMKALWIDTRANTVAFGTCDNYGNPVKVKCENIEEPQVLTFAFIHANSGTLKNYNKENNLNGVGIKVGKIFKSGELCYREGGRSKYTNNIYAKPVHVEVAKGWGDSFELGREYNNDSSITSAGAYRFKNSISLFPQDIFYRFKGWNVVGTVSGLNGYAMKEVTSRTVGGVVTPPSTNLSGCYLNVTKSAFSLRAFAPNGLQRALCPIG